MIRLLIAIFSICHGLVHGIMFALPYSAQARADMTFNPSDSWLIGETRTVGFAFALAVMLAFAVAGAAYLWRAGWWPEMTIVAAVLSLALLLLYASPWWSVGYLSAWHSRFSAGGRSRVRAADRRSDAAPLNLRALAGSPLAHAP